MAGRGRGLMGATATEPLNWLTFRVDAPAGPPIALSGKLNRLNRIHRPAAGPFILPSQPGDRGTLLFLTVTPLRLEIGTPARGVYRQTCASAWDRLISVIMQGRCNPIVHFPIFRTRSWPRQYHPADRPGVSNGTQSGPRIGMEKGPLTGVGTGLSR
jgi:hypothetical protein